MNQNDIFPFTHYPQLKGENLTTNSPWRVWITLMLAIVLMGMQEERSHARDGLLVLTGHQLSTDGQKPVPKGPITDFWRLCADKSDIRINLEADTFDRVLQRVASGDADVVAGLFYSEERALYFDFSKPFMQVDTYVYFHENVMGFRNLKELAETRVGVVRSDYAENYLRRETPTSRLVLYDHPGVMMEDLARQEINYIVLDEPVVTARMRMMDRKLPIKRANRPLYSKNLHAGVRKGNSEALAIVNRCIEMVSQREREAIQNRWLGVPLHLDPNFRLFLGGIALLLACIGLVIVWNRQLQRRISFATHSLKRSEQRYRAIFDTAQDGIILVVPQTGSIHDMNERAREMLGYDKEEITHLTIDQLIMENAPTSEAELAEMMSRIAEEGAYSFECRTHSRKGHMLWTEINVGIGYIEERESLLMMVRDVSERKQAEKEIMALNKDLEDRVDRRTRQLEETQKELVAEAHRAGMADIASNMLHNVGNILTSVTTTAHVLQDHLDGSKVSKSLEYASILLEENMDNLESFLLDDPKGKQLFRFYLSVKDRYQQETTQLKDDISRLLVKIKAIQDVVVAQQSYASGVSYSESLPITKVIADALAIENSNNKKAGVRVDMEQFEIPVLVVQKAKLIHIIINIIKNAREAMSHLPPEKKVITISLKTTGTHVIAYFKDEGIGIEPDHQNRIFTHGFTTKQKGHGFGLHSCAIYMEEMGGRIECESPGVDQGATFKLLFPLPAGSPVSRKPGVPTR